MLKQPTASIEQGFLIFELLLSLFILCTLGATILTVSSRFLRITKALTASVQPNCERPTCALGERVATCSCGRQTYVVLHE
jgi:hypothetical protein